MRETNARRRIRRAVESRGYEVEFLEWEPPYYAGEMMGTAGGWCLYVDPPYAERTIPGNDLGGLSVEEVLADIDYSLRPKEPCDCDLDHHAVMRASIKNDPEKTTHAPECKWHIKYKLRWWGRKEKDGH